MAIHIIDNDAISIEKVIDISVVNYKVFGGLRCSG